ncbi:MAG: sel1 repeat family protein [Lachnospiraceae bacterium]|nr:sel1 repeat family protein [Lachnospiraceae bacterium]
MGRFFSDVVEQALRDIYYDMASGHGQESFRRLEEASEAGDGDATCLLARCLCGYQYTWVGHGFPEDDKRAEKLMHKSVEQGSAVGVLLALRSGELSPQLMQKMPFSSLQEAFNIVLAKAEQGDAFCQYTIGNVYFWWDFLRIEGKGRDSFSSDAEFKNYMKNSISKCEGWFLKAYEGGMYHAGNNLNNYYQKGDEDFIPPMPWKCQGLWQKGADKGYPPHQYLYARELDKAGKADNAFYWHKKAMDNGELDSCFYVGLAYERGDVVPQDCSYAASCYEKGLTIENVGCLNRLGALYFDGKGVPQNYEKGVQMILKAHELSDSKWGFPYLGKACFYGYGLPQDYTQARKYLEQVNANHVESSYLLGLIYAQGLGVAPDIKRGVEYLQRTGNYPPAKEELKNYKKTLFGKWVRR